MKLSLRLGNINTYKFEKNAIIMEEERLTQLGLGTIEQLTDEATALSMKKLGKGTIRAGFFRSKYLKIQTPQETIGIKTPDDMSKITYQRFKEYTNTVLLEKGLYFTEVDAREGSSWNSFFPHRMKGMFYKKQGPGLLDNIPQSR